MKKLAPISALILSSLLVTTAKAESIFVPAAIRGSTATARFDCTIVIRQVLNQALPWRRLA